MRGVLFAGLLVCCAPPVVDVDADGCDPFVVDVVSFLPGSGAGFGADQMPEIVRGPPASEKDSQGSFDVVSLGSGGVITLELGCPIIDGEGVDFIVYENAFFVAVPTEDNGLAEAVVFSEPGEVAVSADGEEFVAFPCTPSGQRDDGVNGCAGTAPVRANARNGLAGDFEDGGGDGFDLAALDVDQARFVRITDRSAGGGGDNAGFDLDAVAVVSRF